MTPIERELCEASVALSNATTEQYGDAKSRWIDAVIAYEKSKVKK